MPINSGSRFDIVAATYYYVAKKVSHSFVKGGVMITIGDRVKTLRERKGISQRRLAEMARVTPATVSRLESGKIVDVKASALIGMADALGVSIDFLVGRVRELTPGDVINFDPNIQAIVQAYLNLGPDERKRMSEYTIFLEFKKNEVLTNAEYFNERKEIMKKMPDMIIKVEDASKKETPEA